ncbi:MAG TPA: alpha/beta fold hydrolase, partial [Acidimicrobiales bacterium]|nr:alpha/beta fold hydrolase [Acidimicrobiales bacterium]
MSGPAVPTWLPHDGGPLFAWVHSPPAGAARATAVICPPLAREHDASHAALRALADGLALVGVAALRFDYYGTGDSAGGEADERLVDSWLSSIQAAVAFARQAGEEHVAVVGLRMGATLAASVAAQLGRLEALVLWDPCPQGRAFVREQYMLQRLALRGVDGGGAPDGWTEIPGGCLSPDTTARLQALEPPAAVHMPAGTPILLLTRQGESPAPAVAGLLVREAVTHLEVPGQRELLETAPSGAAVRPETVEAIVAYLSGILPAGTHPLEPAVRSEVSLPASRRRPPVVERAVRLGGKQLFGIVTEARGEASATVVFLNAFFEHHLGPSRQWVELSRLWAEHGVRSLRFDTTGLGDSPLLAVPPLYTDTLVEDAVTAASLSGKAARDVVFVGLCSGAWVAAMAAVRLGTRAVSLINQMYWKPTARTAEEPCDEAVYDPVAFLEPLSAAGIDTTLFLSAQDHEYLLAAAGQAGLARLSTAGGGSGGRVEVVRLQALDHDVL